MKTYLSFSLLVLSFALFLSGCDTFQSSTKHDEITEMRSGLSEELVHVKQEINSLKGQIDELQYKIDKISHSQSQQSSELNSTLKNWKAESQNDVEERVAGIESKIHALEKKQAQDKTELHNKTNIIVEEVSKENKELRKQIESLKKSPLTKTSPAVLQSDSTKDGYYTVEQGDTLVKIAQRHGISLKSLMEINNITDANSIRIGQKLIIPQKK